MATIYDNPAVAAIITQVASGAIESLNEERREGKLPPLPPKVADVAYSAAMLAAGMALRTLSMTSGREELLSLIEQDTRRAVADGDVEDLGTLGVEDVPPAGP